MSRTRVLAAFLAINSLTALAAPAEKSQTRNSPTEIYCEWINSQWVCWEI